MAAALEQSIANVGHVTGILDEHGPEDLINLLLIGFNPELLEEAQVAYKCYCSRERVCRSIASIDTKELEDMVREGKPIEVTCQFCDSIYTFEPEEILRERRGGDDDK